MLRKTLHVSIVICLLAALIMPASAAVAQQRFPPAPQTGKMQADDPAKIDLGPLPEVIQKATQLQQSLSPSQQAAMRAVLDQYQPELMQISAVDVAGGAAGAAPTGATGKPLDTNQPESRRMDGNRVARMQAVLNKIDAGMVSILNADQLNLYRAAMRPESGSTPAGNFPMMAAPGLVSKPDSVGLEQLTKPDSASSAPAGGYTSYCFYGAEYDAITSYYAYWGYIYAYYNYTSYGTTNSYYAYIYAYYAFNYILTAINYSAPLYFSWYYAGWYLSGSPYNAYYYSYYARYYSYYAYQYAYADYQNTGHTYAYYAYLYNYYAWYYGYYGAEYYTYYCYSNS